MADSRAPGLERYRRLSKEGAWIILGQASAVLGTLAGVRLLTELLNPAAFGELALGLTVAAVVNQTVIGPLGNGVARFYAPAQEQADLGGYLRAVRGLARAATAIIALLALLTFAGLLITGQTQWLGIATAALIFATFSGYNVIISGIQNAARQRSVVALHQGTEPWARFLAAAGLLLWLGSTSALAMSGYAIGSALILGSQYIFFRRTILRDATPSDGRRSWREQIWKYSWPFSAWGIFTWAQFASDRWALEFFGTTQDVGLYAALFQLGYYPMSMATAMAMQFLGPIFYQRAGDASDSERSKNVSRMSRNLTALSLAMTGTVFSVALVFHPQIFRVLAAREYAAVSYLLPWMLLAGGIFAAGQTIGLKLMSQMKTRTMVVPKIATSALGVVLNIAGAYFFGIRGIVVAILMFSVLHSVWMVAISIRSAPEQNTR